MDQRNSDISKKPFFPIPERTPLWEDLVIIVSIVVLWPVVLRRESFWSRMIMVLTLLVLIFILGRRLKRINRITGHDQ
ncbi:MAG: hypothetical protein NC911_00425 [Candidatus Omnitrophica bacterium]|nr:hypothetical protein [Candidatus Omnitrophota bacterium]